MPRITFPALIIYSLIFTMSAALAQMPFAPTNPIPIVPTATDSRISSFNDPHIVWLPTGPTRRQLLLFLTGTNGIPRARFPFYRQLRHLGIMSLNYHIQTMWPLNKLVLIVLILMPI